MALLPISIRVGVTAGSTAATSSQPDDEAIDRFAAELKARMAVWRAAGWTGWQDKALTSNEWLSRLLREGTDKGDPVDVGAFAMMIHQRAELIAAPLLPAQR